MSLEQTRRDFLKTTTVAALASGVAAQAWGVGGRGMAKMKVGLIGCGGRGTGAVADMLTASPDVELWAMGDAFSDRLSESRSGLAGTGESVASRCRVADERCFAGFDAYQKVLASGVDIVILATCPHFRPIHLEAAVKAGKHVFMEKPVAVDPAGIRKVLAAGEMALQKKLGIVAGTQRRHEKSYLAAMAKLREGAIGKITGANCYWNQQGLWVKPKDPSWSDMEWNLRNWLYFTWTSGDHIVEQHVHNIDVCNWAMGRPPVKALAMGGRQARTGPEYGHIYDHFAVQFHYDDGTIVNSFSRQQNGAAERVGETIFGTQGTMELTYGFAEIKGENPWKFSEQNNRPYVQEHKDLLDSIMAGNPLNEAKQVAESTLMAIMGRMSAYTGKEVSWDFALKESKLDLSPPAYAFGPVPAADVAIPGRTPLI